ncbi:uncharacterized protein LOC135211999 isoform X3 [Macrobrachium nipponense]|uniref:uncharacterized protein LOC135211999 isoform X3 n=1 Tax=Macrobrachium nipponense TaxID=159736 RepID=UPI0030C88203
MASSSRRKLDEKNLKILRELGALTHNRTCFDCHQRGTTYINMTVGSFVCTSCSGILRGLNPPHRVKSISMASFTPEEIEQIKSKGNQYCQAVWLGLYDSKANPFPDTKDEHKIRDFMISKYEKKRFYIDPIVALKNMPPQTSSTNSSNASTPSGETSKTTPTITSSVSRPNVSASQSTGSVGGPPTSTSSGSKNSTPKSSASLDLLADLGNQSASSVNSNDPFASPTNTQAPSSISQPSFANFENANIFTNTAKNQPPQIQTSSSQTSLNQPSPPPPPIIPPPSSRPSTQSPSPRRSPSCFSNWEAFDGEEATAATPLIPSAEAQSGLDVTGRPINSKGKSNPNVIFAAGVSAQFVCPTNPNFAACAREDGKLLSNSTASFYSSSAPGRVSIMRVSQRESNLCVEEKSSSVMSNSDKDKTAKITKTKASHPLGGSPSSEQKLPQNSEADDIFAFIDTKEVSSDDLSSIPECKEVSENISVTIVRPKQTSSKRFATFLMSSPRQISRSYQSLGSGKCHFAHDAKTSQSIENMSVEIGQIALELESGRVRSDPRPIEGSAKATDEVGNSLTSVSSVESKTNNPFLNADLSVSAAADGNSVFDNVPLFNKRRLDSSKPVSVVGRMKESSIYSSSCPSSTFPVHASPYTNPFVPVSQPGTNTFPGTPEARGSGTWSRASGDCHRFNSFDDNNSSAADVFAHDFEQNLPLDPFHDTDNSMTAANYIIAGSTSSNKSTPSGPPPTFSNSPLTPMAPGSSSHPTSSANHTNQASNQPLQDRYAALKDLDEEFKTQKETETVTSNGGGSWTIPNGSHHGSTGVFNGSVFGSPGASSNVYSSGLVNGGSSGNVGGGVFGTPPTNGSSTWANFSGANPFSGSSNGTGSPWANGSNAFGSTNHTQQGFGSVVQPNPFGTTLYRMWAPDPNFNQFGSNAPINGTSPNNGAWANFNQQPQTKIQWMTSNGSANPFMAATPQMPSSGSSYNPFL